MVVSDGCEYEVPSHYSRTEQVTYIWSKYVLAQIFLAAVQNEDYELCREIKGTFEKHGFDETYSKEELSAEFKEWYGKDEVAAKMTDERFDRIHNAVLEKSFIEAKNFLGLKY